MQSPISILSLLSAQSPTLTNSVASIATPKCDVAAANSIANASNNAEAEAIAPSDPQRATAKQLASSRVLSFVARK